MNPIEDIEVDDAMIVAAATDINAILKPNPLLDLEKSGEELQKDVEELFPNIVKGDTLSKETWITLMALGWEEKNDVDKKPLMAYTMIDDRNVQTQSKGGSEMSTKPVVKASKNEYAMAAADICKSLNVNPPLNPNLGEEALSLEIKALLSEIREGDDLAVTTWATLKKLGWKRTKSVKVPNARPAKVPKAAKPAKEPAAKSKYGHRIGSQGAAIDEALVKGKNSLKAIAKAAKCSEDRASGHIKHLAKDLNIAITITEDEVVLK